MFNVDRHDQDRINRYSYLIHHTNRLSRLLEPLAKDLENQKDALEELEVIELEGDASIKVPVKFGMAFFHLPIEQAKWQVEAVLNEVQGRKEGMDRELEKEKAELADLKKNLEGKFGDAIRLE